MDKGISTNIGQNDKGHLASKVSHYGSSNSLDFSQCGLKMDPWSSEGFWWNEKSIHRRSFPGLPYFNEVLINCVLMMHRPIAFQSRKIEHCSDKQYSYWKSTKLNSRGPEGTQGQQDWIRWIKEQTRWKTYNTRWNQSHSWSLSRLNGTETYPMETVIPEEKLQKVVWNQRGKDLRQSSFMLKS